MATAILDENNEIIGEFFLERRIPVPIEQIPKILTQAVIAAEDAKFYSHEGLDFMSILRAMIKNIAAGEVVQGGSTITQQVVKSLLLTPERSLRRKVREAVLAYRLEKYLSKDEILYLYLNQIYFGNGAYGVQAAAQNYFGCTVEELNLAQCALLAGLPRAPSRYSPVKNPTLARERQHYVLNRMVEAGFITKNQADEAARTPCTIREREDSNLQIAPYYVEYVREYVADKYGKDLLYQGGLKVYTALRREDQKAAQEAIEYGVRAYEKRHPFRGPLRHLDEDEIQKLDTHGLDKWGDRLQRGEMYPGLVIKASPGDQGIMVRVGDATAKILGKELMWASSVEGSVLLRRGDVVEVRVKEIRPDGEVIFSIEQEPELQGALFSMDLPDGYVRAMVGGLDFRKSPFNRAIQAVRQPGSAFKPIIYAAALDKGYTPATIVVDSPIVFQDSILEETWKPQNYTGDFVGPITVREALAHSRNIVTIKVLQDIGVPYLIRYAKGLGIKSPLTPYLSLALGTSSVTLLELTEAYSVFACQGDRPVPVFIKRILDRDGRVLEENEPRKESIISPQTAYLVTSLLKSVIEEGTGKGVSVLGVPCAGKTGTTNDYVDAWFMGYTPDKITGVWVGYDQPQGLGEKETGARAAAPIWLYYMKKSMKGDPTRDFPIPEGIIFAKIDTTTGLLSTPNSEKTKLECFKEGTEPTISAEEYGKKEEEEETEFFMKELELNHEN
jgi:penicillin-binding protein 1A